MPDAPAGGETQLDVALFDYDLPPELIAQEPSPGRAEARMMVLDRATGAVTHERFRDLPRRLRPGDCLVLNDTRVMPARLIGRRPGGGQAEALLLREIEAGLWEALVRPGARLRPGARITFGQGELVATVVGSAPGGLRTLRLEHEGDLHRLLDRLGQTPLPPYIKRPRPRADDRERYQTIYARRPGAAAAPTAGLHFDHAALDDVRRAGAALAFITLHVGLGTFQPVTAQSVEAHRMHAEWHEIGAEAAHAINAARADGGRVLAVGTTCVRALETRADDDGAVAPGSGMTDLFIRPGYRFRVVDALLTNFHLPRSTLLMMVAAFAGRDEVLAAYREAVAARYRFYSYGDCMLIV